MVRNSRMLGRVAVFGAMMFCFGSLFGTMLVTVLTSYSGEPVKKMTTYDTIFLLFVSLVCLIAAIILTKSMQSILRKYL